VTDGSNLRACAFKMTNVMIIHGVGGKPEENWFPWLKQQLESLGCKVIVPQFPTSENQTLVNWFAEFEKYSDYLNNAILIGHSLGGCFVLNVLEKFTAKAAFLIASVSGTLDNEFDESMKTFSHRKFDWGKIKSNCKKFYVLHSDNDPYIPLEAAEQLARNLGVELTLIRNGQHLNESAGYKEFQELLDSVKKEL